MKFNLLNTVDADEVSPVRRGANRKRVVLKEEGDAIVDPEVADILSVPWAHEGAMLDVLRKSGVDEAVQKSMIGGLRLLTGSADDLPDEIREVVEKLGVEMYARVNRPLNTSHGVPGAGELSGSASSDENDPVDTTESGADTDATVSGPDLDGDATSAEDLGKDDIEMAAAADCEDMDDGVMKDGKEPYGDVTYADPGYQSDKKKRYPLDTEAHIRAAWSYINMPKNASKYSSAQVAQIKSRVSAAMKRIGADVSKEEPTSAVQHALRVLKDAVLGKSKDVEPLADVDNGGEPEGADIAVNKGGTVETHAAVPVQKEDGSWDFTDVPAESAAFYRTFIEKQEQTETLLKAATETLGKVTEAATAREVIAKAESLKFVAPVTDLAEVLKSARENLDPEMVEKLEGLLGAANARLESSDLFTELGKTHLIGAESPGDAWSQIEKMAEALVEKSGAEAITKDAAIVRVLDTEAGKRLYEQDAANQLAALAGGVN